MSDKPEREMGRLQMRTEMIREPHSKTVSRTVAGSGKNQIVIRAKTSNIQSTVPKPFLFNHVKSHNKTTKNKLLLIPFPEMKLWHRRHNVPRSHGQWDTLEPELSPASDHRHTACLHLGQSHKSGRDTRLETGRPGKGRAPGRVQMWLTRPQTAFRSMTGFS